MLAIKLLLIMGTLPVTNLFLTHSRLSPFPIGCISEPLNPTPSELSPHSYYWATRPHGTPQVPFCGRYPLALAPSGRVVSLLLLPAGVDLCAAPLQPGCLSPPGKTYIKSGFVHRKQPCHPWEQGLKVKTSEPGCLSRCWPHRPADCVTLGRLSTSRVLDFSSVKWGDMAPTTQGCGES